MTTQTPASRRPKVAVVFGGRSGEHAISCVTAAGVLGAIDRDAYDVVPIGITQRGRWVLADDDPKRWQLEGGTLPQVGDDEGPGVLVPLEVGTNDLTVLSPGEVPHTLGEVDVVFPLLHGPFGEDGTIRGVFSNGATRDLGQLRLARFANPTGLVQRGQNLFAEGVNSGLPVQGDPGQQGIGTIIAGATELSNTDIGTSLIDLILASTMYRGNTRVITTSQQMLDELLALRR